ncbi:hypothetical protein LCX93_12295 [Sulfurimonas sp. SWIR-19]|uniref:hypothetical protein n=1 Tax=Sulfurimonas sp. SWIR-19 TaxID=2878390 RepID=UPI001CF49114|nr:hypothetical protein [Sulfurimonas sp. SWIR-19]UCN00286.1 hypothetical protein LCX93_12295 [Sulfurimonas sp. SWIR-19]
MHDRRKKSKILPIFFLFLQITAFFFASYFFYLLAVTMGVSINITVLIIAIVSIFAIIKFFARYFEVKNRIKYMDYEYFGKKEK